MNCNMVKTVLERKLISEIMSIYVRKNLAKEFEERSFKMTGIK